MAIRASTWTKSPNAAVAGQVEGAAGDRMKQVVEALHYGDSRGIGGVGNPLRLFAIAGEGLLGQHRLARGDGRQVPPRMKRVRQRVVHDVNLGIADHIGVRRQNPFHTVLLGEGPRSLRVARGHGDQSMTQFPGRPDDGQLGDAGRSEHPDPQAHNVTHGGTPASLRGGQSDARASRRASGRV